MYRKRNTPGSPAEIPAYLDQELSELERAQNDPRDFILLNVLHVAPAKVMAGMMVEADGTDWNPGAGAGTYVYRAGAWVKIG